MWSKYSILHVYLRAGCRNQPYCSHVCAADGLDFLDIPVALFIHQLERKKKKKRGLKHKESISTITNFKLKVKE